MLNWIQDGDFWIATINSGFYRIIQLNPMTGKLFLVFFIDNFYQKVPVWELLGEFTSLELAKNEAHHYKAVYQLLQPYFY